MAGIYIQLYQSVFGHRKTRRMARRLKMPCVHVAGHLAAIWCWAMDKTADGFLPEITEGALEEAAEWEGKPGALVSAMKDAGYLDVDKASGVIVIHDWQEYAGKLIQRRAKDKARKQAERAEKADEKADAPNESNVIAIKENDEIPRVSGGCPQDSCGFRKNPAESEQIKLNERVSKDTLLADSADSAVATLDLAVEDEYPADFTKAYTLYRVKEKKQVASKSWGKLKAPQKALLVKAIVHMNDFLDEFPSALPYAPQAGTFFNGAWQDYVNGVPASVRARAEENMRRGGQAHGDAVTPHTPAAPLTKEEAEQATYSDAETKLRQERYLQEQQRRAERLAKAGER